VVAVVHRLAAQQGGQHAQVLVVLRDAHGCWPIVRIAVLPVPMPRCTRPGASRFSVAIAATCTGGIRVPQMAVPGPRRIRRVCRAARASTA